jgi:Biotin carboxylase, N-terminal domain
MGKVLLYNRDDVSFIEIESAELLEHEMHFLDLKNLVITRTFSQIRRMGYSFRVFLFYLSCVSTSALIHPKPSSFTRINELKVSTSEDTASTVVYPIDSIKVGKASCEVPFFNNVMAANRAEIAVRIMRAATEMNAGTVAIYGHEDRYSQHRWGADRSYKLDKAPEATPISAYLDIPQIIKIAKEAKVDAIHPG